jgi:hypothetical protein
MQKLFMIAVASMMAFATMDPVLAAASDHQGIVQPSNDTVLDRRGRGGRSKPRVPGGSGCDDPRDLIEHPECRA